MTIINDSIENLKIESLEEKLQRIKNDISIGRQPYDEHEDFSDNIISGIISDHFSTDNKGQFK